ncbi:hypothetical protein V3519_02230 [Acinetobacter variabilis]|uniref:hypothetical protein n=1 Tax=Acinetobacter variabilis TaxID=70346 RepID=UPI0030F8A83E
MKIKEGGGMDIQELIDFKYEEIEGLKLNLSEDHHMNPEQEDELEELIAQAIKFGELCAKRDAKAQAVPEKDAVIKKLSDQLYAQEMKASAARVLCETACELLDDYAHQDAMVILDDLEQAMKEPAND